MEVLLAHPDSWEIDSIFSKMKMCQPNQSSSHVTPSWLKNELHGLTEVDKEILESKDGWLNDNRMNAGQQLICKTLGSFEACQLVLNC